MGRDLLTLPPDELRKIRGKDIAMVFQDPFACLHPMYRVGAQIAEAVHRARRRRQEGRLGARGRTARPRRHPEREVARARLPAPVLGRHAPARDDRDGARPQPVDPDLRRADDRARRDGAGADPRADRGGQARVRHRRHPRHARPRRRRRDRELGDGHVRRPDHGVRPCRRRSSTRPQHPYAWGLLDSMPTSRSGSSALVPIEGSPPSLLSPPSGCPFHPRCRYRFEPCPTERPPLVAPAPDAHPDACHLPWERQAARRRQALDRPAWVDAA